MFGFDEDKFLNCECEWFFKAYRGKMLFAEQSEKQAWERLRILGSWVLSPYSKTSLTPKKLLPLPWDTTQINDIEKLKEEYKKIKSGN